MKSSRRSSIRPTEGQVIRGSFGLQTVKGARGDILTKIPGAPKCPGCGRDLLLKDFTRDEWTLVCLPCNNVYKMAVEVG